MRELVAVLEYILQLMSRERVRGEVATQLIPELARGDPRSFGIAVATADGKTICAGDTYTKFTIQSIRRSSR